MKSSGKDQLLEVTCINICILRDEQANTVNLMVLSRMGSATQDVIQTQAKQALSGLNAEMWSSYMQFCEEEKEKESRNLSQSP